MRQYRKIVGEWQPSMEVLINRKFSQAYEGAEPIAKVGARSCVVGRERRKVLDEKWSASEDFTSSHTFL